MPLPNSVQSEADLEELLSRPDSEVIQKVGESRGDYMVLGAGGKMGVSLTGMIRRALDVCPGERKVTAVSRFSDERSLEFFRKQSIQTLQCDLLDPTQVNRLPKAENLVYLAGQKFGTSENKSLTWVSNTLIPANVTGHFKDSRIVALSTGCVYPLACSQGKGSNEQDSPEPVGEYAQSCLGRERIFEYFSKRNHTSVCLVRLNYATDLRYGVLVDIAGKVKKSIPVDLSMGYFNVIWQGDAIRMILKCTSLCSTPPTILNVTGPEKISVRWLAEQFGSRFNTPPVFIGNEMGNALLSDATIASSYFNEPEVSLERMIRWTADWIESDGRILDIPTHFEVRNGEF